MKKFPRESARSLRSCEVGAIFSKRSVCYVCVCVCDVYNLRTRSADRLPWRDGRVPPIRSRFELAFGTSLFSDWSFLRFAWWKLGFLLL